MTGADHLLDSLRLQARAYAALGSPMYAELLDRIVDDVEISSRWNCQIARPRWCSAMGHDGKFTGDLGHLGDQAVLDQSDAEALDGLRARKPRFAVVWTRPEGLSSIPTGTVFPNRNRLVLQLGMAFGLPIVISPLDIVGVGARDGRDAPVIIGFVNTSSRLASISAAIRSTDALVLSEPTICTP
jgi:hypothetical protein